MNNISVERTDEAILIKLPLETKLTDVQQILNFFEYINLVGKSEAKQDQIDDLAQEVNQDWWVKNKSRFIGKPGFEEIQKTME